MSDYEKMNIYVPGWVKHQIEMDNEMFGVIKKDGHTPNKNAFLSMILQGYYDLFVQEGRDHYNTTVKSLKAIGISNDQIQQIASAIQGIDQPSDKIKRLGKGAISIPYKPTGKTENLLRKMEYAIINPSHLSRYIAQILIAYCKKPINQRELIIFKDLYDTLDECCRLHQCVFFTTGPKSTTHTVLPYAIVAGKEELFNYLICQEINPITSLPEARTYRLNKIRAVSRAKDIMIYDTATVKHLEKMMRYGAQYEINNDDQICVRLTEMGWKLFNTSIYFGKPTLEQFTKTEDSYLLHFSCSEIQIELYFRRFGKEAEILYPESLRQRLIQFHHDALAVYHGEG